MAPTLWKGRKRWPNRYSIADNMSQKTKARTTQTRGGIWGKPERLALGQRFLPNKLFYLPFRPNKNKYAE